MRVGSHRLGYSRSSHGCEAWEILLRQLYSLAAEPPSHSTALLLAETASPGLPLAKRNKAGGQKAIKVAKVEEKGSSGEGPTSQPSCQPLQVSVTRQH